MSCKHCVTRMGTWRQLDQRRDWWELPGSLRAERQVTIGTCSQCDPSFNEDQLRYKLYTIRSEIAQAEGHMKAMHKILNVEEGLSLI